MTRIAPRRFLCTSLAICIAAALLLCVCVGYGALRYRVGVRDTLALAQIAQARHEAQTAALHTRLADAEATLASATRTASDARGRTNTAVTRVQAALVAIRADTTPPEPVRILVTQTEAALVAWDGERAALDAVIAEQGAALAIAHEIIAGEAARTAAAVQAALKAQPKPSRVTWFVSGALLGLSLGLR